MFYSIKIINDGAETLYIPCSLNTATGVETPLSKYAYSRYESALKYLERRQQIINHKNLNNKG